MIIEMVIGSASKKRLLKLLSKSILLETLIQSLAVSVMPTESASWTERRDRLARFSSLSPLKPDSSVEIAPALQTSEATVESSVAFWENISIRPILVKEGVGLVRARILCRLINEVASLLLEGTATAEDIDREMKLENYYPMRPQEWGDYRGLDMVLDVLTGLHEKRGEDR